MEFKMKLGNGLSHALIKENKEKKSYFLIQIATHNQTETL
jgi:hypothetical protein